MTIYNHSGEELLNIEVTDESYRYRSIMQDNSVTLYYSLTEHVELPVGSYVEFQGERYTLWRPENFKKHGSRNFEYTVTFGGNQEVLKKYKFKLLSSLPYRLKFDLVAQPQMVIELLVDNLNLYDSGWSVGQCIEAGEKALSFNHEFCYDVLNRLAQEFDTEWEIEGKTIHFCKVEKFRDAPLTLSYGKGNGFKTGVGRSNEGDKQPVSVLYVQGGERNIDFSKYKSKTLLLPKSQTYTYEGRAYRTDKEGMYITRADKPLTDVSEDSYDAGEIYPKRVGTISEVVPVDTQNNLYDFIDKDISDNLNYEDCLIAGERMTVIFQSGQLAGKEFEVKYIHTAGNEKAGRRFEIVPQEIDGTTMPDGETFVPRVGDTYAVFGIQLPDAYICDNATQTGGSWEMFKEAVRYFYKHEEPSFTFSGELDGIWARRHWLEIGGKIQPGGYVDFSDTQFQPDGVLIRITGVKDYINRPHSPSLELSNLPVSGSIRNDLGKIEANEVVVEKKHNDALQFTKRRYRDAKETMQMLIESLLNFSDAVNPIAIQTMQLLLGDKSLQFRFVDSKTTPSVVAWNIAYNRETKELTVPGVILQHMTLGITEVKPVRAVSDYQFWDMASYGPIVLEEPAKKYYLYAKCSKDNQTGSFLPSERAIGMEQVSGYYHFLVGILNSEHESDRSFAPLYGYTEILPGQITTDCIKSADGGTYFDLARNTIAGNIRFISSDGSVKNVADTDTLASEAKDKVAESLGYTNYAALEGAAQTGQTIIKGGLINTDLLVVTSQLIANAILTNSLNVNNNFIVNSDGTVSIKGVLNGVSGTFSGNLEGASGSFKQLNCINNAGQVVGSISFDSSGRLWFRGDMYHQGYENSQQRGYRFYTHNLWCRGAFGARTRTLAVVENTHMYYYTDGREKPSVSLSLSFSGGGYTIPLNGDGDTAGISIDLVIFKNNGEYTYQLNGFIGKIVHVVNANDDRNVFIKTMNNGTVKFGGGSGGTLTCIDKSDALPTPTSNIGEGWLVLSYFDNNWS